jgi:ABC transporter C-terminal domain
VSRVVRLKNKKQSLTPRSHQLSFKERKELESLPARIEALELEIQELHDAMAAPAFYKRDGAAIAPTNARLGELEAELANVYPDGKRWRALGINRREQRESLPSESETTEQRPAGQPMSGPIRA